LYSTKQRFNFAQNKAVNTFWVFKELKVIYFLQIDFNTKELNNEKVNHPSLCNFMP
jgi:hypothetical protein